MRVPIHLLSNIHFYAEMITFWDQYLIAFKLVLKYSLWSAMTALECWCLAMIGLVFESLLAYVIVLLCLFREKEGQVEIICITTSKRVVGSLRPWISHKLEEKVTRAQHALRKTHIT